MLQNQPENIYEIDVGFQNFSLAMVVSTEPTLTPFTTGYIYWLKSEFSIYIYVYTL